jgi:hypothetical protein
MRSGFCLVAMSVMCSLVGCDRSQPAISVALPSAPHHGTMIPLAEGKGFVELVNEPEVSDRRHPEPTSIVAYFLQADGKTPLDPAPADVAFAIETGGAKGGRGKQASGDRIPLTAQPRSEDLQGAGRFASKPGPFNLESTRGTLTARIGSQEITSKFAGSR